MGERKKKKSAYETAYLKFYTGHDKPPSVVDSLIPLLAFGISMNGSSLASLIIPMLDAI
jgi:hypothetical protein